MQKVNRIQITRVLFLIITILSILNIGSIFQTLPRELINKIDKNKLKASGSSPIWEYTEGDTVRSVAISSDSNYIVAGTLNNKILLFHKSSSTPLWSYTAGDSIFSVDISSNGKYIVACGYDNAIRLFENTSSTPLWSFLVGGGDFPSTVAISSDGNYIIAGSEGGDIGHYIYLFHKSSSYPQWRKEISDGVESVAISSDGSYMVVGSRDNKVRLFHRSSSTPLWSYTAGDSIFSVDIGVELDL
ncbi:hypothetical protein ES703_39378 [subsurface metagenome]